MKQHHIQSIGEKETERLDCSGPGSQHGARSTDHTIGKHGQAPSSPEYHRGQHTSSTDVGIRLYSSLATRSHAEQCGSALLLWRETRQWQWWGVSCCRGSGMQHSWQLYMHVLVHLCMFFLFLYLGSAFQHVGELIMTLLASRRRPRTKKSRQPILPCPRK